MAELIADVETPKAQSYLGRICARFAHKLPVDHDGPAGAVTFEAARCELSADGAALHLRVTGEDEHRTAEVAAVIERHLLRFATREGLTVNGPVRQSPPCHSPTPNQWAGLSSMSRIDSTSAVRERSASFGAMRLALDMHA